MPNDTATTVLAWHFTADAARDAAWDAAWDAQRAELLRLVEEARDALRAARGEVVAEEDGDGPE